MNEIREIDQLWELAKTRASAKTMNIFIGLVIALILSIIGAGGSNYIMYANTNERVAKIETQMENLVERQRENNQLLKDIEKLLISKQH